MLKFRKRPIEIEAVQFTGENHEEIGRFMGVQVDRTEALVIETLEGFLQASPGDWIIRGVKGEFYPCRADVFEATYEAVPSG